MTCPTSSKASRCTPIEHLCRRKPCIVLHLVRTLQLSNSSQDSCPSASWIGPQTELFAPPMDNFFQCECGLVAERRDRVCAPDMQGQFSSDGGRTKEGWHGLDDRIHQLWKRPACLPRRSAISALESRPIARGNEPLLLPDRGTHKATLVEDCKRRNHQNRKQLNTKLQTRVEWHCIVLALSLVVGWKMRCIMRYSQATASQPDHTSR